MKVNSFFPLNKTHKILIPIPTQNLQSFITKKASFILLLILAQNFIFSCFSTPQNQENQENMKVHPLPKKRNITIQYYINNTNTNQREKKLRRLPHIFSRVLELPFRSDAEVAVEENQDCFRFVAEADNIGEVRAHTIEIHPGVTKIVVRPNGYLEFPSLDDLELDMWRFRLPESTRPELASAVFLDGELIVTVPKGEDEVDQDGNGEFRGGMGNNNNGNNNNNNNARLVLVQ